MMKPDDLVVWRGVFRNRIWHAIPTFVVRHTSQELVTAILPGTECMVEEHYARGVKNGKRRWDFMQEDWVLKEFIWHTNRVLTIVEPEKYYSIMLFWNHEHNEFLGYYINFQVPFKTSHCGIDSLDLELDIDIEPDLSSHWKDEDDYQVAIERGIITPEWVQGIERSKPEVLEWLEKRQYPFNGSWLDWMPDPTWSPPRLPEGWDKV